MFIGIFSFIVIGILAGFIASKVVNLRGDDPMMGIASALAGALVGGILFSIVSGRGVVAWDIWGILCAVVGGAAGVVLYHMIRSRTISHTQQTVRRSY